MPDILVIAATRLTKSKFEQLSLLGPSLGRMIDPGIESAITYNNRRGLPAVFNSHIVEGNRNKILVFTHDDVRIDDDSLSRRLDEGLRTFDVLGVAGNRRRVPNQPAWAFTPDMQWDADEHLSGGLSHIVPDGEVVSSYGKSRQQCRLLDGVFMAVRASALIDRGLRFDEQYAFHFYDMDFCRSAEKRGLTLGTWPIAITHASGGSFGSPAWKKALKTYRMKWPD